MTLSTWRLKCAVAYILLNMAAVVDRSTRNNPLNMASGEQPCSLCGSVAAGQAQPCPSYGGACVRGEGCPPPHCRMAGIQPFPVPL